jgi:hypothetical protein
MLFQGLRNYSVADENRLFTDDLSQSDEKISLTPIASIALTFKQVFI